MQMLLNHKMITKNRNINLQINENINSTMNYKNHISILTEFCLLCNCALFLSTRIVFQNILFMHVNICSQIKIDEAILIANKVHEKIQFKNNTYTYITGK